MSLILFAENLLEATTTTVTGSLAAATGQPITRLYDRDRGPQYKPGSVAQLDIDINLGAATAVTGWALVNHTATGVTVTLYGDSFSPPTTARDSFAAASADVLRTFAQLTLRYWRIRIPVMAAAPLIGEAMLGNPRTITLNPSIDSPKVTAGNVRRDRSPAGYLWSVNRGDARIRLPYQWRALSDANVTLIESAYTDCDEGAKKILVQDPNSVIRFMDWLDDELVPTPLGNAQNEMAITLEQAL